MNTKDEALALALEALEAWTKNGGVKPGYEFIDRAITAIKQAQQGQEQEQLEARACEIFSMGEWCLWPIDSYEEAKERGWQVRKLVVESTHPAPKQAEPVGINGLTEAETNATMSVMGLSKRNQG